jgi:CDP-glucose 4,6-dehydratase
MFANFYRGRRVLVTGHTGFKGGWLSLWLKHLGASVSGLALPPHTQPCLHEVIRGVAFANETECDVRDLAKLQAVIAAVEPELIFHLAAQPLVLQSYIEPAETVAVNAVGTLNVLEAVRRLELSCAIVVVTSDKCYANHGWEFGYRENDPLGGHDIYSTSKAAAELIVDGWRRSFFRPNLKLGNVASARAGNVIGGGDYAPDRLVPDCIRALLEERPIPVRHPRAARAWQHVLDCLSGYLWLGAQLAQADKGSPLAGAFNFGPGAQAHLPVARLVEEILRHWPGEWKHSPSDTAPPEAERLNLSIEKAAALLGWLPVWDFEEAVRQTVAWYRHRHVKRAADVVEFSLGQIETFSAAARGKGLAWAGCHST